MFVYGGIDAFRHPESKARRAMSVIEPLRNVTSIDAEPAVFVRVNGVIQLAAGLSLAAGVLTRTAAGTLAGSLVLTTVAGHRFWEETDATARAQQTIHFLKNASMLGGLLAVVAGG